MFIQSCFIRKNTPELRKKLENIGIYHNDLDTDDYPWLISNHGMYMSMQEIYFSKLGLAYYGDIDCGDNEDLFLALAALRDDSDKYQWFVSNINEWFLNRSDKFRQDITDWVCDAKSSEWHKATADEIIEHFKN